MTGQFLVALVQGSGPFLAERTTKTSYFNMYFLESHTIENWCHIVSKDYLIDFANALSSYMTSEDDTSVNFRKSF